jgi:hypothetical protein
MLEGLGEVASSYLMQRGYRPEERPVVFAAAELDSCNAAFQKMEIQTVPHLYIFPVRTITA